MSDKGSDYEDDEITERSVRSVTPDQKVETLADRLMTQVLAQTWSRQMEVLRPVAAALIDAADVIEGYGDNCSCWVRIGVIPDYDGHPYEEGDDAGCCGKVVQQALHAIWVCNAPEWAHTLPENTENTKGEPR